MGQWVHLPRAIRCDQLHSLPDASPASRPCSSPLLSLHLVLPPLTLPLLTLIRLSRHGSSEDAMT